MKSVLQVVQGGGWHTQETTGKPWARFFGFAALVWLGLSVCATLLLWSTWPRPFGYLEWLCVTLLALQFVLFILTAFCAWRETPRTITARSPNHDYDRRNLY